MADLVSYNAFRDEGTIGRINRPAAWRIDQKNWEYVT
jgi:hypothetical protein